MGPPQIIRKDEHHGFLFEGRRAARRRPGGRALTTRYGTLVEWARQLGRDDCAAALKKNRDEEKAIDKKLTMLAESKINLRAAE